MIEAAENNLRCLSTRVFSAIVLATGKFGCIGLTEEKLFGTIISAMDIFESKKIIYTAQSRHLFYARMLVSRYVLEHDAVPLNPFNVWGYFLYELVDRDMVRRGNNNIVRIADEIWVFGPISNGVVAEINYAMRLAKPLKFFSAGSNYNDIHQVDIADLVFESDALQDSTPEEFKTQIWRYLTSFT